MKIESLLSSLGLSLNLAQDVTLVLILIGLGVAFGFFLGRHKLLPALVSIYVSLALIKVIPNDFFSDYSYYLILFIFFIVALSFFSKKIFKSYISSAGKFSFWRTFILGFLEVGLIASAFFALMPKAEVLEYISSKAYIYLVSANAQFFWTLAPLVFVGLIYKKINR